jgi:hypothetical protein
MAIMAGIMGAICLIQTAIGIWWVVYLNRRKVRDQFAAQASASAYAGFQAPAFATPPSIERPLSILIIGWLMAVTGFLFLPFYLVSTYPVHFLGMLISGWAGRAVYVLYSAACAGIGIGLIRLRPLSRQLAIAYFIFGSVNALTIFLAPGAVRRFLELSVQRLPPQQAWMGGMMLKFIWIGVVFGLALNGVQLWFLITRREAYLAAARQREAAAPAA